LSSYFENVFLLKSYETERFINTNNIIFIEKKMVGKEIKSVLFYSSIILAFALVAIFTSGILPTGQMAYGNFTNNANVEKVPNANEYISLAFNITFNNTATRDNLTFINISFPSTCSLVSGTNGTDLGKIIGTNTSSFIATSSLLTLANSTNISLMNPGNITAHVWFNLTCTTNGTELVRYSIGYNKTLPTVFDSNNIAFVVNQTGINKAILTSVNTTSLNASYKVQTVYNFSLQNIGTGNFINVTNLTITSPFTITAGSAGTDAPNSTIVISGNTITFFVNISATNSSLVPFASTRYLWFNGTGSGNAPDSYFTSVVQIYDQGAAFQYNTTQSIRAALYDLPAAAAAAESASGSYVPAGYVAVTKIVVATATELAAGKTESLKANEQVKFTAAGGTHTVAVSSVTSTSATVTVSSTPQQATLNIGDLQRFDLNSDGTYDISVKLNSVSGSQASITVTAISDSTATTPAVTPATPTTPEKASSKTWIWIIIIVVIIIAAIVGFYLYNKKKQ